MDALPRDSLLKDGITMNRYRSDCIESSALVSSAPPPSRATRKRSPSSLPSPTRSHRSRRPRHSHSRNVYRNEYHHRNDRRSREVSHDRRRHRTVVDRRRHRSRSRRSHSRSRQLSASRTGSSSNTLAPNSSSDCRSKTSSGHDQSSVSRRIEVVDLPMEVTTSQLNEALQALTGFVPLSVRLLRDRNAAVADFAHIDHAIALSTAAPNGKLNISTSRKNYADEHEMGGEIAIRKESSAARTLRYRFMPPLVLVKAGTSSEVKLSSTSPACTSHHSAYEWLCEECPFWNYAHRLECHRCKNRSRTMPLVLDHVLQVSSGDATVGESVNNHGYNYTDLLITGLPESIRERQVVDRIRWLLPEVPNFVCKLLRGHESCITSSALPSSVHPASYHSTTLAPQGGNNNRPHMMSCARVASGVNSTLCILSYRSEREALWCFRQLQRADVSTSIDRGQKVPGDSHTEGDTHHETTGHNRENRAFLTMDEDGPILQAALLRRLTTAEFSRIQHGASNGASNQFALDRENRNRNGTCGSSSSSLRDSDRPDSRRVHSKRAGTMNSARHSASDNTRSPSDADAQSEFTEALALCTELLGQHPPSPSKDTTDLLSTDPAPHQPATLADIMADIDAFTKSIENVGEGVGDGDGDGDDRTQSGEPSTLGEQEPKRITMASVQPFVAKEDVQCSTWSTEVPSNHQDFAPLHDAPNSGLEVLTGTNQCLANGNSTSSTQPQTWVGAHDTVPVIEAVVVGSSAHRQLGSTSASLRVPPQPFLAGPLRPLNPGTKPNGNNNNNKALAAAQQMRLALEEQRRKLSASNGMTLVPPAAATHTSISKPAHLSTPGTNVTSAPLAHTFDVGGRLNSTTFSDEATLHGRTHPHTWGRESEVDPEIAHMRGHALQQQSYPTIDSVPDIHSTESLKGTFAMTALASHHSKNTTDDNYSNHRPQRTNRPRFTDDDNEIESC